MAPTNSLPCISLPSLQPMTISLPFGGQLQSLVDMSKGPPSDCTLIHGLMIQLGPLLAGLSCVLKLLKVITAVTQINPSNPTTLLSTIPNVVSAAADFAANCIPLPIKWVCTIVDILKLLVAYLKCLIASVLSVLEFQAGIDFTAAQGNPVLLASLNCAQNNAAASMGQLKDAITVVESILSLIQPAIDFVGSALPGPAKDALKSISDIKTALESVVGGGGASVGVPGVQGIVATLQNLQSELVQVQGILNAIPC